jgi:hypothetical protein
MQAVRYYTELRWATFNAVLAGLAGFACWLVLPRAAATGLVQVLAVWAGLLVAGLLLWVSLARIVDRRPALIIDSHGVRDRRSGIAAPWDQILEARIWEQNVGRHVARWIALDVIDPAKVRTGTLQRSKALIALAERMEVPEALLNIDGLGVQPEAVLAEIARFRPGLVR